MDRNTFDQTIRAFKHREPFRPFTVVMRNGNRMEVDHPDGLAFRDGAALFISPGGRLSIFDHKGVCHIIGGLSTESADDAQIVLRPTERNDCHEG